MSADNAFYSFANFARDQLAAAGSAIVIVTEKDAIPAAPYAAVEMGTITSINTWCDLVLCQIRLVVDRVSTEPLELTAVKRMAELVNAIRGKSPIDKWDYSETPKTSSGALHYSLIGTSVDLSKVADSSMRVITINLYTNAS